MTKHNLFSNVLATNGLARGYRPRPHKRKRKGLRFALVVLLLAVLGSRSEETSIEIWMWTAGITGLCWLIAKLIRDRTGRDE